MNGYTVNRKSGGAEKYLPGGPPCPDAVRYDLPGLAGLLVPELFQTQAPADNPVQL